MPVLPCVSGEPIKHIAWPSEPCVRVHCVVAETVYLPPLICFLALPSQTVTSMPFVFTPGMLEAGMGGRHGGLCVSVCITISLFVRVRKIKTNLSLPLHLQLTAPEKWRARIAWQSAEPECRKRQGSAYAGTLDNASANSAPGISSYLLSLVLSGLKIIFLALSPYQTSHELLAPNCTAPLSLSAVSELKRPVGPSTVHLAAHCAGLGDTDLVDTNTLLVSGSYCCCARLRDQNDLTTGKSGYFKCSALIIWLVHIIKLIWRVLQEGCCTIKLSLRVSKWYLKYARALVQYPTSPMCFV